MNQKPHLLKFQFILIGLLSIFIISCKDDINNDNNQPKVISDQNFYSQLGGSIIKCYVDIYNQNLAGKPTGTHNINTNGPMGGEVNISGNTTYDNTHGITTTDLIFAMNQVQYVYSASGYTTEITLTGSTTYSGSFSNSYTSVNHQSQNIHLKGSVTHEGIIRNIDMWGEISINRSTKTSINIFGHLVTW
jgi:hypothetical protein